MAVAVGYKFSKRENFLSQHGQQSTSNCELFYELRTTNYELKSLIFAQIFFMETQRKSRGMYWTLFFASLVGAALIWIFIPQIITLSLPFIVTFFAKAMDIM
jgi:hypothetical protein